MKRTLLLTALATSLFSFNSNAQITKVTNALPEVDLGVKLGVNMQQLSGGDLKPDYRTGIFGGAFVGVHKKRMGVQVEGLVRSVKYDFKLSSMAAPTVRAIYVDVPVLFQYKLISRVWLQAGPQFSFMVSAKDNADVDVKDYFKSSDISGVVGIDVRLPFRLSAGARYVLGFADINNSKIPAATEAWRNRAAQVYLGFRFL